MSQPDPDKPHHHHSLRERLDAAEAAADEVVADEGGQLGGEVSALALPFEEAAAALRAAIDPDSIADDGENREPGAAPSGDPPPEELRGS